MRVTIVKPDGMVGVDGLFLPIDLSTTYDNLRVVQWDTDHGHEEWTDQPNTEITSIAPYQHIIDAWNVKKAEADARAADPYYGMTKEQIQAAVEVKIVAEEDRRSYLPLVHEGHTYKVSSAIQDTKLIILGTDPTDPLPLNNGCWDDVDGVPVPMTVGEFYALAQAAYTRGATNYGVRKYHIVEMKKAEDPSTYDYSGGWA